MTATQYYVHLDPKSYEWQHYAFLNSGYTALGVPIGNGYIVISPETLDELLAAHAAYLDTHDNYPFGCDTADAHAYTLAAPLLEDRWTLWLGGYDYQILADELVGIEEITGIAGPIAASTWRGYVARGTAPKPDDRIIDDKGRARPVWWRSRIAAWMMTRPGQGARTDLTASAAAE